MSARISFPTPLRLIAILLTLMVVATLEASLAGPALGATHRVARCDGANLRARASTHAKNKIRMPAGTKVVVTGTVTGGHWKTFCGKGSHSGNTWFKITSIGGRSVKSRFGVKYLYGATHLYRKVGGKAKPKPAPPASCTRHVNVDKSGNSDVTSELQKFVDASPNGAVICFASGGDYRVNGMLHIQSRSHLTLEGNGARIFQTSRSTSRIVLIDGSSNDIRLHALTIEGANPNPGTWVYEYEHNHGIEVGGAINLEFSHVKVKNVGGDGLYLSAGHVGSGVRWADEVRFHHSVIDGTGRSGISIADGASDIVIDYNTLRHIAYYTLNIEPNGLVWDGVAAGARNVRFSDNTLGAQPYGTGIGDQPVGHVFVATGSSGGGPVDGIKVARNTISGKPFDVGVYDNGGLRRDIRIIDNHSDTSAKGTPMAFEGVETLVVTGNHQPLDGSKLADVSGCSDVTIKDNETP